MRATSLLFTFAFFALHMVAYSQNSFVVFPSDTAYITDTVTAGFTVEKVIGIRNTSDSGYTMKWVAVSNTGPHAWQYACCDLENCYNFSYQQRSFYFGPDSSGTMKLTLSPNCVAGTGQLNIRLWVEGDSAATTRDLTWFITVDTATACMATALNNVTGLPDVNIFPNPATSSLQVITGVTGTQCLLALFDVSGRIVHECAQTSPVMYINMLSFAPGTYILKVFSPEGVVTKKVQKI